MKPTRTTLSLRALMVLCAGASFIPGTMRGQSGTWEQTNGPEGANFRTIVPAQNGPVGIIGSAGLFQYKGGTWTKVSDFIPSRIIPAGSTLIGVQTGSVMEYYRSDDDGATWEKMDFTSSFNVAVSVVGASTYAVRNDTLFVSDDGLKTMEPLSPVPQFFMPPVGRDGLLLMGGGFFNDTVYSSVDGGKTWRPHESNLPSAGSAGRLLYGGEEKFYSLQANATVYRSTDGINWELLSEGLPESVPIDWLAANDDVAFLKLNSGGIYRLDGSVWKPVTASVHGYAVAPALEGNNLLLPTNTGAFVLSQDGSSVTDLSAGLRNMQIMAMGRAGDAIFAGGINGIYRSLDQGEHWDLVGDGYVSAFESNSETIFALVNGDILRSTDYGETWVSMQTKFDNIKIERWGSTEFDLPFSGITSADDGTLYITISQSFGEHGVSGWRDGGVFRSEDNGETWSEVSAGLPTDGFTIVPVNDAIALDEGMILISTLDGIFRSGNQGVGWSRFESGLPTDNLTQKTGAFFLLNDYVYLRTSTALYRTDKDASGGWEPVSVAPLEDQYWSPSGDHANIVDGRFHISLAEWDGVKLQYSLYAFDGTTWEDITDQMPDDVIFQAFVQDENRVYAGSQGHSVWSRNLSPSGVPDVSQPVADFRVGPNPALGEITIRFNSGMQRTEGRIAVCDLLGKTVRVLHDGAMNPGENEYRFDGSGIPAGAYIVQVTIDGRRAEQVIIKR